MEFGLFEVMQRVWKTGLPERLPIRHYQDERLAGYYDNYVYKLSSGEIVTVFDNVTAQKLGEAAIKAGEEQLRLIADSIPAFVSMFDAETLRYKFVNRQFELSFAKPREAMIGRHISETLGEENFRFALGFIEEARTGHETGYENSFELADGTHWLQVRYVPQFNAQGRVSDLIVLAFDVTQTRREREKSESLIRDKELILKEGHHRSKNYMNTISSLLRLQAGLHSSPEIAGILDDVAGRIAAMEILYDKLYSSDQGGKIPLRDYLSSLLDEIAGVFPRTRPVRLDVEIDDLVLDSKPLSTLGIIVNELMTNSMKHAFKGREDGWIGIKVSQRDAMLRLSYEDDGPGLPEAVSLERSTGFGLELVGMLAGKLGGSLVLERGRGARFVLEFEAFPDQR